MSRTVFVENVDPEAGPETVRERLPERARIESLDIREDPKSEDGGKVAFIQVAGGRKNASAVVQALDGTELAGRPLKAKILKNRSGRKGHGGFGGGGGGIGHGRGAGGKRAAFGRGHGPSGARGG